MFFLFITACSNILLFQQGILAFLNNEYEEAYDKLSLLKLKDIEHLKVFSDILYNYAIKIQNILLDKNIKNNDIYHNKELLKKLISNNIKTCNKILTLNSRDKKTIKRLCILYLVSKNNKEAEKLITERKIKLDELNMKDFQT